jgi:hypothetical protein
MIKICAIDTENIAMVAYILCNGRGNRYSYSSNLVQRGVESELECWYGTVN